MNLKLYDTIDITIRSLGSSGEGVGHYSGFTVFVDQALPGEIVQVKLTLIKKNYAKATLIKILTPSQERQKPICPLFQKCGGCQIMHLSYQGQLKVKQQKVLDALKRIGHFVDIRVEDCIPSPSPLHYRNKIQLPVNTIKQQLVLGFYEKQSHAIIPVEYCYIHCELGQNVYEKIKKNLTESQIKPYNPKTGQGELKHLIIKSAITSKQALALIVSSEKKTSAQFQKLAKKMMDECPEIRGVVLNINPENTNTILSQTWMELAGTPYIYETLLGLKFKISPASFFQVNPLQAQNLYTAAIAKAQVDATTQVLDIYCGVGTLSLLFAMHAKKVIGIESIRQAILDAEENAANNHIDNCQFICGKAEDLIQKYTGMDLVILNPPRKGCDPRVLASILKSQPKTVLYISCDPATLARDLSILCEDFYNIDCIQPFDMFPQTMHVETLVKLKLNIKY